MTMDLGVPKEKIIVGIPLYGQSFQLTTSEQGYGAPARGRGTAGKFTLQDGMLAYYEICQQGEMRIATR